MTQPGETDGYSVEDHVRALIDHGACVDGVVVADDPLPQSAIERYAAQDSTPVMVRDASHDYAIYPKQLLTFDNDLIRHDPQRIEAAVRDLLQEI